jgi:4-hydroxybenzoate polyprenyltransferase
MIRIKNMVKVLRPKQWIKNLLVAAAPIAAGKMGLQAKSIILGFIGFSATLTVLLKQ